MTTLFICSILVLMMRFINSYVGGLINAPQMGIPNLAQAAPIMDRAVPEGVRLLRNEWLE